MAQGSTRFEYLEKSIDDYIIKQQKKFQELIRREMWSLATHWISERKTRAKKSWRHRSQGIERISLQFVWSEKTAKTLNLQVMFQKTNRKVCQKYWLARLFNSSNWNALSRGNNKRRKSNADSSRAIQGCCVLRRKFYHQYLLVLFSNGNTKTTNL